MLPQPQQLEISNYLARSEHYAEAMRAYEGFLAAYPAAPDAPQIRLYAGLICSRYLRDPQRALLHLRAAVEGLTLQSQRELARHEIEAAQADISGRPPTPPAP